MEDNKRNIIMVVIGIFVGITILASVLVPVLNDANSDFNPTFENKNDNGIKMAKVDTATITKSAGVSDKVTINDVEISLNGAANAIVLTNSFMINARTTNFYVITASNASNVNQATAFSATIGSGSITYQIGTADPVTVAYTGDLLVASPTGDHINMSSGNMNLLNTNDIYCWTWANSKLYVSEGITTTVAGVAAADTDYNATVDQSYNPALYKVTVSGIKMDSGGDDVAPNTCIVPVSVKTELANMGGISPILSVIPLIVIIAILLGVVAVMIMRGRE